MLVLAAAGLSPAAAQNQIERFPVAAMDFLNTELPQMQAAVTARDRTYFHEAMERTLFFADSWGFKAQANPALQRYRSCTDAVSDFAIVGMCRLTPGADECDPALATRFDQSLRRCGELAATAP